MLITALRFQTNFNFPTARVLSFRRIQPPQKLLYIYIYVAEGLRCCKPANLRHRVQQRRLFVAHRQIPSLPTTPLLLSFSIFFEKSQERLLLTVVTPQTLTAVDFISAVSTISVRRRNFRVELRFLSSISPIFLPSRRNGVLSPTSHTFLRA